jgi:IclR family KDG regulon transcriptional repressor
MKQTNDKFNSVEKALRVLMAFNDTHPFWGVRQLSAHLGFSPATVQRLLQTLKNYDFIAQTNDTSQYRLGNIYYSFLHTLQSSAPITRAAVPYMEELLCVTQETVHLNVIDGNERVCIDTLESMQHLKASMPIGNRSPLYAGASSKCLLSFSPVVFRRGYLDTVHLVPVTGNTIIDKAALEQEIQVIREKGYAQSLGERSNGLGSLSTPIHDHRGILVAALSLAIPEIRFRDKTHRAFCLENLCRITQKISNIMGYKG